MSVSPELDHIPAARGAESPAGGQPGRRRPRFLAAALLIVLVGAVFFSYITTRPVVAEAFDGIDGTFVSQEPFWDEDDRGLSQNDRWYANNGTLDVRSGWGRTDDDVFRMWTRRTDLQNPTVRFDMVFRGFTGGTKDWRGLNLWLNRTHCTPVPECSAVDDEGGNSGYMLRFVAADGHMIINKKVPGDTREQYPERATSYVQGGTYYWLAKAPWQPVEGREYELAGSVRENADGTSTVQMSVDGEVLLTFVDDGSFGGPPPDGGRVGLRGDYVDVKVDDLEIYL